MKSFARCCGCWALLVIAAGCTPDYPFDKPGTWHPAELNSNDANLRVMVANPEDLVVGRGSTSAAGPEAEQPVHRLMTGQRYPLPSTTTLQVNLVGGTPPAQPGQEGANAGQ